MDDVIARIKGYVETLYPDILSETGITEAQLTYYITDVVDRALVYMNRDQLVVQYEEDVEDYDTDDDIWDYYDYPIPPRLERTLANVVVGVVRTLVKRLASDTQEVTKIKDQGQEVTFGESLSNYLTSSNDSEVFTGSLTLLDKYTLGKVLGDTSTKQTRPL
jgi:hypothetical protein